MRFSYRRFLPWLGLACVLASFVIAVVRVHPTDFFGFTEDDSIYFSSAKALAEGKGYVLESFPGTPAATKYPVFYPWVLSWVWRWNPSFPANLSDAIAVTVAFGIMFLTLVFLFFRQMKGISDAEALILTAFCALHPRVIFYSGQLLTDIPFAALLLAAVILAEKAAEKEAGASSAACCGIVTGLAMLLRVLGVPLAAGIVVALTVRRIWKSAAIFCGCVAPFFGALAWRAIFPHAAESPAVGAAVSSSSWIRTWAYYTNYLNVWKEAVPNTTTFTAILKNNALLLLRAPADYFASPWPAARTFNGQVLAIVVTFVIVKGILRLAKQCGARSIPWVLAFYVGVVLCWVYIDEGRFLVPFLPMFAAALWVEVKYVVKEARLDFTDGISMTEKLVAAVSCIVVAVFACAVSLDYIGGLRKKVADLGRDRAALLPEKREAYDWLARSTDRDARVVAFEDGSLYLYSGRAAVRPMTFAAAPLYDPTKIATVPEDVANVARAVGATYWLVSGDDFSSGTPEAFEKSQTRELERTVLPIVYSSGSGHVRIYSLNFVRHPDDSSYEYSQDRVLSRDLGILAVPDGRKAPVSHEHLAFDNATGWKWWDAPTNSVGVTRPSRTGKRMPTNGNAGYCL